MNQIILQIIREYTKNYSITNFPNKTRKLLIASTPTYFFKLPKQKLLKYQKWDAHFHIDHLSTYRRKRRDIKGLGEGVHNIEEILLDSLIKDIQVVSPTSHFGMRNLENTVNITNKFNHVMKILHSKYGLKYKPRILIPAMEISCKKKEKSLISLKGRHVLVHIYFNTKGALIPLSKARYAQRLADTITDKNSTLVQLLGIELKYNRGEHVINGFKVKHSGDKISVTPAHYRDFRGVKKKRIFQTYNKGYYLKALEVTNATSNMFDDELGSKLREVFTDKGPADLGGSDAHHVKLFGAGFTLLKEECVNPLDVFNCVEERKTSTGYVVMNNFKRLLLNKNQYLSPYYVSKFVQWLLTR